MPLKVTLAGRQYRTDHLTLGQMLDLEESLGKRFRDINPWTSARDAFALAEACSGLPSTTLRQLPADVNTWIEPVDDDLPEYFFECVPRGGGRSFDDYLVVFADPQGFGWPPDVTRRQRIRDLDLLQEAFKGRKSR